MSSLTMDVETAGSKNRNKQLARWVDEVANLCKPDEIHWCDGSEAEYRDMLRVMVFTGTAIPLNEKKRPKNVVGRPNPAVLPPVEDRTFICPVKKEAAGPTNNWEDPESMQQRL